MAARHHAPMRRKRGTPTVQLNLNVAPDIKARIDHIAAHANVPVWAVVEAAIEAGQDDATGIPTNWNLHRHPEETLMDQVT